MTNAEIKTVIRDDLSIATGDLFFSDAYIQRIANRAVKWFAAIKPWQQTQYAYTRDSVISQEYYNYPEDFQTDTIKRLKFNGEKYTRKSFQEYLNYQDDEGSGATEKIFSDHRRQFFINPIPTAVAEISIWGQLIPATMSADADTHPFAGEQQAEEAIVKYAIGIAMKKGRGTNYERGKQEQLEALQIADKMWTDQKREQAKYGTKSAEMIKYIDILPTNGGERRTQRGNFNTCD